MYNSDHYMVMRLLQGGTTRDQPRGTAIIVAGDLNTDLGDMASDGRRTEIAAAITEAGLEYMTAHFLPSKRKWGR